MSEDTPDQVVRRRPSHYTTHSPEKITTFVEKSKEKAGDQAAAISKIVYSWPNLDTWQYKLGLPAIGVASASTGAFLNFTFRNALYLGNHLRISTYLGIMAMSAVGAVFGHHTAIERKIFTNNPHQCSICLQIRSAFIQVFSSVMYPMVLAPVMSYSIASAFKDRYLPKLYKKPRDVFGYVKVVYKPIKGQLGWISMGHILLAMGLTYLQQECFYTTILPVVAGKETFKRTSGILPGIF